MRFRPLMVVLVTVLAHIGVFAQSDETRGRSCFIGAKDLTDRRAPRFEQYAVKAPEASVGHAKLNVSSNRIARAYRTVLRGEMGKKANFAGHYRVAVWGCGSSCAMFAVLDLNTGRVITPEAIDSVSGVHFGADADDFLPGTDSDAGGFRFKKNSRLLVLVGTMNEDDSREGAYYFLLKNQKLMLLHKTVAKRNTCQDD